MINLNIIGVGEALTTSLTSIVETIFGRRVYREQYIGAHAPTGEAWKSFSAGGELDEEHERNGMWPMLLPTPEEAIARYIEDIYLYSYDHHGVLYWNVTPIVEQVRQGNQLWYQVYSSFLLSEAPVIQPQAVRVARKPWYGDARSNGTS